MLHRMFTLCSSLLVASSAAANPTLAKGYPPAYFEVNVGHAPDGVLLVGRQLQDRLHVERSRLVLRDGASSTAIELVGGHVERLEHERPLSGTVQLVKPSGTVKVPAFESARAPEVWPGVALSFVVRDNGFAFDAHLDAGVDPAKIRFRLPAPGGLDQEGNLVVKTEEGTLVLSRPIAHQPVNGKPRPVPVSFRVDGTTLGFELGRYDPNLPIVIDPRLIYATYLDHGVHIAVTSHGPYGVVIGGLTIGSPAADPDIYVAKFDPRLTGPSSLVFASVLYGNNPTEGVSGYFPRRASAHADGRILFCGANANTAFRSTDLINPNTNEPAFGYPVSIVLSADGATMLNVTSIPTVGGGQMSDCAWMPTGNRYAAIGGNQSAITTPLVTPMAGHSGINFVLVVDLDEDPQVDNDSIVFGSHVLSGAGAAPELSVDPSNTITFLATGTHLSPFLAPNAFQTRPDEYSACKLNPDLGAQAFLGCTFFGGTGGEGGAVNQGDLTTDPQGNVYILLNSASNTDYPAHPGAVRPAQPGFLAFSKLNASLSALEWTRFGTGPTFAYAARAIRTPGGDFIILDQGGSAYPAADTSCSLNSSNAFSVLAGPDADSVLYESRLVLAGIDVAHIDNGVIAGGSFGNNAQNAFTPLVNGFDATPRFFGALVFDTQSRCLDLALSGGASANIVTEGDVVRWTATVRNAGPDDARDVEIPFVIPAQLQAVTFTTSQGTCQLTPDLRCLLGTVPSGASVTVELMAIAAAPGAGVGNIQVTSPDEGRDPNNNRVNLSVSVNAATGPCGAVSYFGRCDGATLSYCEDRGGARERRVDVACDQDVFPSGVAGTCALIDAVYGYDCAVLRGEECIFQDGVSDQVLYGYCAPASGGCIVTNETSVCTPLPIPGGCTTDQVGQCFSDLLLYDCHGSQGVAFDCRSVGGTCADGVCGDIAEGGACDPDPNGLTRCQSPLLCHEPTRTCVAREALCDPSYAPRCVDRNYSVCTAQGLIETKSCTEILGTAAGCEEVFSCRRASGETCASPEGCVADRPQTGSSGRVCNVQLGAYCPRGESCVFGVENGRPVGRCTSLNASCTGEGSVGCVGEVATACYTQGDLHYVEPSGIDCQSFGGECEARPTGPGCRVGPGSLCDPNPDGVLTCTDGNTCRVNVDGEPICQSDTETDGGLPEDGAVSPDGAVTADGGVRPDAGTPDAGGAAEDEGCGCNTASERPSSPLGAAFLLGLFGLVRLRRRARAPSATFQ